MVWTVGNAYIGRASPSNIPLFIQFIQHFVINHFATHQSSVNLTNSLLIQSPPPQLCPTKPKPQCRDWVCSLRIFSDVISNILGRSSTASSISSNGSGFLELTTPYQSQSATTATTSSGFLELSVALSSKAKHAHTAAVDEETQRLFLLRARNN